MPRQAVVTIHRTQTRAVVAARQIRVYVSAEAVGRQDSILASRLRPR